MFLRTASLASTHQCLLKAPIRPHSWRLVRRQQPDCWNKKNVIHNQAHTEGTREAVSPLNLQTQSTLPADQVSAAPSPSLLFGTLVGLPLALWAYKVSERLVALEEWLNLMLTTTDLQCMMMVFFQRKIIYMGYIPPGARTEVGTRLNRPSRTLLICLSKRPWRKMTLQQLGCSGRKSQLRATRMSF